MTHQGADDAAPGDVVPDHVVRSGQLPAMRYHDLPDAIPVRKMLGPGIILAGMALGSGEFILWPYITYRSGFVFFWAAIVGVAMQYLINMEITRWTLATGETAVTAFAD
ncbi:MAG: Nramp family divalent metal transporter [Pirellulaceae bacterium]